MVHTIFYELEFSEVPALIGAFALGPWQGYYPDDKDTPGFCYFLH